MAGQIQSLSRQRGQVGLLLNVGSRRLWSECVEATSQKDLGFIVPEACVSRACPPPWICTLAQRIRAIGFRLFQTTMSRLLQSGIRTRFASPLRCVRMRESGITYGSLPRVPQPFQLCWDLVVSILWLIAQR